MTNDEYTEWAKSLKPGDKVAVVEHNGDARALLLVTKAGVRIVCGQYVFAIHKNDGGNGRYRPYGELTRDKFFWYHLEPWSEEYQKQVDADKAERNRERHHNELVGKLVQNSWNWWADLSDTTLEAVMALIERDKAVTRTPTT